MTSVCSGNTCAPRKKGVRSCNNITKQNLFDYLRKVSRNSRQSDTSTSSQKSDGHKKSGLKTKNKPDTKHKSSKSTKSQRQVQKCFKELSVHTQKSTGSACKSSKSLNSYRKSDESDYRPSHAKSIKKTRTSRADGQKSTKKSVKTRKNSHKSRHEPDNTSCSRGGKQANPTYRMENKKTQKKKKKPK